MVADQTPLTHGSALGRIDLPAFTLTEAWNAPNDRYARHSHAWPDLTIVTQGAFRTSTDAGDINCGPGDVLYLPGRRPHWDAISPRGARCLIIELPEHERWNSGSGVTLPDCETKLPSPATFACARQIAQRALDGPRRTSPDIEEQVLELLVVLGWTREQRRSDLHPAYLNRVVSLLHDRFRESLTLSAVAEAIDVHAVHLARVFRARFGRSVGEYIRDLRLEWSAHLLRQTDLVAARIALDAGFYDQAHFTRVFKRRYGLTPQAYRRLI